MGLQYHQAGRQLWRSLRTECRRQYVTGPGTGPECALDQRRADVFASLQVDRHPNNGDGGREPWLAAALRMIPCNPVNSFESKADCTPKQHSAAGNSALLAG